MENNLAENIRRYRKSMGLTQDQLAERLGITLGAVSKWERGGSEPDLSYIMDLAELFHVSVDALIGFTMRGSNADEEAGRIDELAKKVSSGETDGVTVEAIAEEYDNALKKFPNHFRIVIGAALTYQQIGTVYRKDKELRKALELFRHSIDLFSQNKDPEITETLIRNEIAGCYSSLKEYRKAIEEYKKNNETFINDARIGLLYTFCEKKPEEGIKYTDRSFIWHISDMVTTLTGYIVYYLATARYSQGIRMAEWSIRFLDSLKKEPGRHAFSDKITALYYLGLAAFQDKEGQTEASEDSLRTAIRIAAAFDSDPVYTLDNLILSDSAEKPGVYDDTGPTAMGGLRSILEELSSYVSDAFREQYNRAAEAAERQ